MTEPQPTEPQEEFVIDAHKGNVDPAVKNLFEQLKSISDGYMNMSHDDFTLLAQMNDIVEKKYAASADELEKGNEILTQVFEKLQLFKPQFDQIDQIEQSLTTLEQLVKTLDDYSKLLELRFKKL